MREVEFANDGVAMRVGRITRVVHESDSFSDTDQCFGGDSLGHWNVARVNRILDACAAPTVRLPIGLPYMLEMARVGKPDASRAAAYANMGLRGMPPLSFVTLVLEDDPEPTCMLVDGHHRLLALYMLQAPFVPARVLPPALTPDVRIVEMTEVAILPAPAVQAKKRLRVEGKEAAHV